MRLLRGHVCTSTLNFNKQLASVRYIVLQVIIIQLMWPLSLYPAESNTTVLDDLTGADENREGGSGEADR